MNSPVNPLRDRAHRLIDQLPDEELVDVLTVLSNLYCDAYMLQAIQAAKRTLQPGDTFTHDEALRFLLPS